MRISAAVRAKARVTPPKRTQLTAPQVKKVLSEPPQLRQKRFAIRQDRLSPAYIEGPYTAIFHSTCAHCGKLSLLRRKAKYCEEHQNLYGREGRYQYAFAFNPFHFPEIFGATLLVQLSRQGFWNPANPKGLTRDHRVSVNEAIKNNYDPFYIKHPLNCELMPWLENNRKNTQSSLPFQDLVKQIDAWESRGLCS